ncbi:MAG TPA: ATP-binding cassette domain-containing protein [Pyrinomonadaceae bacterium]|jgi:ATP-binding cassette subfamily B protein
MFGLKTTARRLFAAEVIQTSAMDCGPASLKCLLEGHGISTSYGRLREACQIDVDGTSINTLEEVAVQLGLDAEQIMIPVDHVLLKPAQALPALIVVRLPNNNTHFVVAWRRAGRVLQLMDPGSGRRWTTGKQFLRSLYVHTLRVPAADWREWSGSGEFLRPLRQRLARLGISAQSRERLVKEGLADAGWLTIAALDAATRMVASIIRAGGISSGPQATKVLEAIFERARQEQGDERRTIPDNFWTVLPSTPDEDGAEQLLFRGAVLLRVRGRKLDQQREGVDSSRGASGPVPLSPELAAALAEPPDRPGLELLRLLRADGLLAPAAISVALFLAVCSLMIEVLLLRVLFDLSASLGLVEQRFGAMSALLVFTTALMLLEFPLMAGILRSGRHLEGRLRLAFLKKIPKLGDQYFRSRLVSDMAERSHAIHMLRTLPDLGARLMRTIFEIVLTTIGIIWLDPSGAPLACTLAALAIVWPLMAQPFLSHLDLRVRTHLGALSRFYLDSLLGLVAVRSHGAERAIRREHESLVLEWMRACLGLLRASTAIEGLQSFIGFGLAAWLLYSHLLRAGESGGVLLLIYWALNLPMLGQELALIVRQYPVHRNITLRLLEPLAAPEESEPDETGPDASTSFEVPGNVHQAGVRLDFENVSVHAAGHQILEALNLSVEAGSHVAIVGRSGAGKSSLVGLLLGLYRPATGRVMVDEQVLNHQLLERLRRETAWVDPTVQLWNRPLLDNLSYGSPDEHLPLDQVIEAADLRSVLEKLPEGFQMVLGEGGALLSGGEGQRVRFARAAYRSGVRLVILDEPFRGLDREKRRCLLKRARALWSQATLLCITHDVSETRDFGLVLVVEGGRIVEQGCPAQLEAQPGSRYSALLEAEESVREGLWSGQEWRRLRMESGLILEESVNGNR